MAKADHIYVHRLGYTHHGIDMGDGTVIHYTGEVGQKAAAAVRRTAVELFAQGAEILVRRYARCFDPKTTLRRARRRLGEGRYNLAFNNCEHFATWCKTGHHRSEQVRDAIATSGGAVGTGAGVAAGLGTVSAAGCVGGLSGPGILSGLATIGSAVGGGAVAGLVGVGVAPATVATVAMHVVLRDELSLPREERRSRRTGRLATVAGWATGSAAAIGAVYAAGSLTGLSAAGITSGLASIGVVAGGGMAAGVGIVAAAPAVAAVGAGYGLYRICRRWG